MVTSCPLGTSGFECSLVIYLIPAFFVLGSILFRKNVANDLLDMSFSIIGSSALSIISYFVVYGFFHSMRYSVLAGLIGMIAGGFLLSALIGDGESE